jgi:hypothetical protein
VNPAPLILMLAMLTPAQTRHVTFTCPDVPECPSLTCQEAEAIDYDRLSATLEKLAPPCPMVIGTDPTPREGLQSKLLYSDDGYRLLGPADLMASPASPQAPSKVKPWYKDKWTWIKIGGGIVLGAVAQNNFGGDASGGESKKKESSDDPDFCWPPGHCK